MVAAGLAHVGWFKPRIAEIQAQPRKELAQIAAEALGREEPLGVFYAKRNATVFYARRPIVDLGEEESAAGGLVEFLSSPTPAAALTHKKILPLLEESLPEVFVWAGRGEYVLVSNHRLEGVRGDGGRRNARPTERPGPAGMRLRRHTRPTERPGG